MHLLLGTSYIGITVLLLSQVDYNLLVSSDQLGNLLIEGSDHVLLLFDLLILGFNLDLMVVNSIV